jgi:hypothetical protein
MSRFMFMSIRDAEIALAFRRRAEYSNIIFHGKLKIPEIKELGFYIRRVKNQPKRPVHVILKGSRMYAVGHYTSPSRRVNTHKVPLDDYMFFIPPHEGGMEYADIRYILSSSTPWDIFESWYKLTNDNIEYVLNHLNINLKTFMTHAETINYIKENRDMGQLGIDHDELNKIETQAWLDVAQKIKTKHDIEESRSIERHIQLYLDGVITFDELNKRTHSTAMKYTKEIMNYRTGSLVNLFNFYIYKEGQEHLQYKRILFCLCFGHLNTINNHSIMASRYGYLDSLKKAYIERQLKSYF